MLAASGIPCVTGERKLPKLVIDLGKFDFSSLLIQVKLRVDKVLVVFSALRAVDLCAFQALRRQKMFWPSWPRNCERPRILNFQIIFEFFFQQYFFWDLKSKGLQGSLTSLVEATTMTFMIYWLEETKESKEWEWASSMTVVPVVTKSDWVVR